MLRTHLWVTEINTMWFKEILTTSDSWNAVNLPNPAFASDKSTTTAILLPRTLPNICSMKMEQIFKKFNMNKIEEIQ